MEVVVVEMVVVVVAASCLFTLPDPMKTYNIILEVLVLP